MRSVPYIALAALFMLAACGGGGGGSAGSPQTPTAGMTPTTDTDGDTRTRRPYAPEITTKFGKTKLDYYPLNAVNVCAGQDQCWAMVKEESNIASRDEVLAMLQENAYEVSFEEVEGITGAGRHVLVHAQPPVVRFVQGTASAHRKLTYRAIDNINAWLPWQKHITVGSDLDTVASEATIATNALQYLANEPNLSPQELEEVHDRSYAVLDKLPTNTITVNFELDLTVGGFGSSGGIGIATGGAHIFVVQHELLHAMGLSGGKACAEKFGADCDSTSSDGPQFYYSHAPVSKFPESEMAYASPYNPEHGLSQIDGEVISTIYTREGLWHWTDHTAEEADAAADAARLEAVISGASEIEADAAAEAARQAVFEQLEPNVTAEIRADFSPEELGEWDDTVIRYSGSFGSWPYTGDLNPPAFGVDWRNGMARPWTVGGTPYHTFAESGLTGSARWNGELVGFTPAREAVQGDSAINVDLATMAGNAAFTALEHWNAGAPPGGRGTGAQWHDGDLHYTLALDGNYLRSNGGDEGYVSGRFVGEEHQGTVGILERPDLTGAFGAVRQ